MAGIYDFTVENGNGELVSLADYKGKVLLIINSATQCGFTPQYDGLQDMYEKYADEGFEILDFPCDQFGHQAPGTNQEIATFCDAKYGVRFPIFSKLEVNGENASPLFTYLKEQKGFEGFDPGHPLTPIVESATAHADPDYQHNDNIKWNFTKFLIDREGNVLERFEPTTDLEVVENRVEKVLHGAPDLTIQDVYRFLKDCGTYYLATVEGDQPRVRPFGTVELYGGKLYIQTGKVKEVSKQIQANGKVEISGMANGKWIRVAGTLVRDDRVAAKAHMLDQYPNLKSMYSAEDDNTEVLYFTNATATISSFTEPPQSVTF